MKDLGPMHYCLGIEVIRTSSSTCLMQQKYAYEILKRFDMQDCKPVSTPVETSLKLTPDLEYEPFNSTLYQQVIGSLIYLTIMRPDICYAVGLLSQYMHAPRVSHWNAAKRVLHYLKGTPH
eukprot:c21621_g1_i1 orf=3-362(-)